MWLATLRNLPYFSIADTAFECGAVRRAMGKYVVLRFAREVDTRCRYGEREYQLRQEVMFMFFMLANEEGANSPVDYLPLRSGQVSNEPGRNESGANCADFISGKSPCSHEQEMFGINLMPYEFYGWHQSDAILKFIKKAKSIFTDSPIFICE